ncbi:conserved hypothetical protein [Staphylococcus aureus subsp. aureus str. Newman]|uniref:Uncharacterized protein n=1 Tax=Staphylococcus aureus (strain Newman) TaxID=426430 RepID=A0A0H3K7N3_STAAE|nr:conserved hypothetical protein [Staphylococcus aureus subsp. aureus str. Newman]
MQIIKTKNSKKSLSSKTIKMATMVCCEMHFLTTTSFISVSSTIADCVNRHIDSNENIKTRLISL